MDERDECDSTPDVHSEAELVRRLAELGFTGPIQEALEARLVSYALPPLLRWQTTGVIFDLCRREGRPLPADDAAREILRTDAAERAHLAHDSAVRALGVFRRYGLRDGGWRPGGGRSLNSYFLTACIREFPSAYRVWHVDRKRQRSWQHYGLVPAEGGVRSNNGLELEPDHADDVVARLADPTLPLDVPSEILEIAVGIVDGKTYAEIGEGLGISGRAVEGRLRRFRMNHRREL